MIGAAV